MKVHFSLHYRPKPGETLHALVYREGATANEQKINIPLTAAGNDLWRGEIQLLLRQPLRLNYHYEVRVGARTERREWQIIPRGLELNPFIQNYFLHDTWREVPTESWLDTLAMTEVWRRREIPRTDSFPLFQRTLVLRARSVRPNANEQLCLSGNIDSLGNWDPGRAQPMYEIAPNEWAIALNAAELSFPFEYKFLVRSNQGAQGEVYWEKNGNHVFQKESLNFGEVSIYSDFNPTFEWDKNFRTAGTEIPLFSLRSNSGWGCGDFGDIPLLVDWAVQTGQHAIQFLPVNDTTTTRSWQDSSPYNMISSHALHPIYLDMRQLAPLREEVQAVFEEERATLNATAQLDYQNVLQLKLKRLKYAFEQNGREVLSCEEFREFFQDNEYWLSGYAMFCVLRDRFNTADHNYWPQYVFFAREDARNFCALGAPDEQEVRFWYYVQFLLHTQLLAAAQYAREKGVVLIADVPMGLSPKSVDVWMDPGFFDTNVRLGIPSDEVASKGQKFDLVAYNWETLARDGYRWWRQRMVHLSQYFDAYRLNYLQGFFRNWEIPTSAMQPILGQFVPAAGFSKQELISKGLVWSDLFTQPYITHAAVEDVFGVLAEHVEKNYLQPYSADRFGLQPNYSSQANIEKALPGDDPQTALLRRGLCELATDVLFVADVKKPGIYHPRMNALESRAFLALSEQQQDVFKTIYDDYFRSRQNELWKQQALKRLPAVLYASPMLGYGEAVGIAPSCLPEVAEQLSIPLVKIQRLCKNTDKNFEDTAKYPYLCVAMPGTHDMPVLRAWWKESGDIQKFWEDVLGGCGPAPTEPNAEICEKILYQELKSPALLALVLFQDWAGIDMSARRMDPQAERINDPVTPCYYWNYRMPVSLEDLKNQTDFNEKIKTMISQSGR